MKFVVYSLGCKVNQYEGQSMIAELVARGHQATDEMKAADCYIINTCSVTMEADKKSRQTVARVLKLNKNAQVVICGCSSQNNPSQYKEKPNVTIISGSSGKIELLNCIMSNIVPDNSRGDFTLPTVYEDNLYPAITKSRAFIKVQDGCNNFCSYCIVPYLRGRSRSREVESVIRESQKLSEDCKEIVLTGINLSDYGSDINSSLIELVKALKVVNSRKRLGSLECNVVSDELLIAMKDANFCDHFHLSMQCGSEEILKKMNRHYTPRYFIDKVNLIREYFPNAGITTDVISGFPTETQNNHFETIATIKQIKFSDMHIFPYSERVGTKAYDLPQIDKSIRQNRAKQLIEIAKEMSQEFLKSQIGRELDVYVEADEGDFNVGYTSNYIKVYTKAPINSFLKHKLYEIYNQGVKGSYE